VDICKSYISLFILLAEKINPDKVLIYYISIKFYRIKKKNFKKQIHIQWQDDLFHMVQGLFSLEF
jgi:hypothetical protein